MSMTANRKSQFALLDYIRLSRGNKVGYTSANNSTTQIIDLLLAQNLRFIAILLLTGNGKLKSSWRYLVFEYFQSMTLQQRY